MVSPTRPWNSLWKPQKLFRYVTTVTNILGNAGNLVFNKLLVSISEEPSVKGFTGNVLSWIEESSSALADGNF